MTTTQRKRAGIYARQSHGSTRSVDEQVAECTRDLEAEGHDVIDVYRDLTSASRYARKGRDDHERLLADIEAGRIDLVCLWESSRGDRTLESWAAFLELCRRSNVLIRVTDHHETYDMTRPRHWKILAEDGVSNQYSSEETRQRILRTQAAMVEAGTPNGPAPYGYVRRYHERTRELVAQEPDPIEAPIVVEVFERVAAGEPLKPLAAELNQRDVPRPGKWRQRSDGRWTPHAIRELVRRRAYVAKRSHNGDPETTDASWPALVDEALYWRANRVLDDRARHFRREIRRQHVLSGVPVCEVCNGVLSGSWDARYGRIYACRGCGSRINDGDAFEERVLAYVLGRLARDDVYATLRRQGEDADKEAAAARAEGDRLRGELTAWRQSAVRGETTPASLAVIEAGLSKRIEAADRRSERAGVPPAVRDLVDAGDELPARWAAMPLAAQRDVVGALVDVTVARGRRGVKQPLADRVSIAWKGITE